MPGNACFKTHNRKGKNCRGLFTFKIPVGKAWENIHLTKSQESCTFKVDYFKFGQSDYYMVVYNNRNESWYCTCPYFQFHNCAIEKKCCKHIQSCIDKKNNIVKQKIMKSRGGIQYITFMNEHITEIDIKKYGNSDTEDTNTLRIYKHSNNGI